MLLASGHAFNEFIIFDALRLIEIVLAFMLGAILLRVAFDQLRRKVTAWRIYFVLSLVFFCISSALNGSQLLGDAPSPRLFFNTAGLILAIIAARYRTNLTSKKADDDLLFSAR